MPRVKKMSIEARAKRARAQQKLKRFKNYELSLPSGLTDQGMENEDDDDNSSDPAPFIKNEPIEVEPDFQEEDDFIGPVETLNVKVEENDDIPSDYFDEVGITFENEDEDCDDNSTERKRRSSRTPKPSRKKTEALEPNKRPNVNQIKRTKKAHNKVKTENYEDENDSDSWTPSPKRRRRKHKKVSEMTPEQYQRYQEKYRKKYKKVSEMTPEELEAYNNYKEQVKMRYHATKAVKVENSDGEVDNDSSEEQAGRTSESFKNHRRKKNSGYKHKKVSEMTPEELEAYNVHKERARLRYHATKASKQIKSDGEGKSTAPTKRVSEMTPKELEAYNLKKEKRKQKYKKISELDPEEVERIRAIWKEKYNKRKAEQLAKMPEEEKAKYLEKEERRAARRLKAEARNHLPKRPYTRRKNRGDGEAIPLDPEEEQRIKRERYQRMIMRKIEKRAQMTDEEREEERQRNYMRRVARMSTLTPEEQQRRIEEQRKRKAQRFKMWKERKRREGKYAEVQQIDKRQRALKQLRKKLAVQELLKQGKTLEEIQGHLETPEARERRLNCLRINAAKKKLRKKLVADGVHPEEIERQLEHLAKTYKPVRALRAYKPRQSTLLEPIKPEEISLLKEKAKCKTLPPPAAIIKRPVLQNQYSVSTTESVQDEKNEPYEALLALTGSQAQNDFKHYQPVATTTTETRQFQLRPAYIPHIQDQAVKQCHSEASFYSELNDVEIASVSGPPSDYNDNDDYNDDSIGVDDDIRNVQMPTLTRAPVSISSSSFNFAPQQTHSAYSFLGMSRPAYENPPTLPPLMTRPSLPSASSFSSSEKKVGRPIGKPTRKTETAREAVCDICGNAYDSRYLRIHKKHVHHPYYQNGYCIICSQRFKPPAFQVHFRKIHIKNGDVTVDTLDEVFHPREFTRYSGKRYAGDKGIPCDVCGAVLARGSLNFHKRKFHNPYYDHKTRKCTLCGKELKDVKGPNYFSHFTTEHPDVTVSKPRGIKREKKHICDECGMGFTTVPSLRNHKHYKHGDGTLEENFYRCQDCPEEKVFKRKDAYMLHMSQTHPDKSAPLVQCPLCPLRLGTASQKNEHVKDKHPDRYWPCQYCGTVRISEIGILSHYSRQCSKITREEKLKWAEEKVDVVTVDKMVGKCELCGVKVILESLRRHYLEKHVIQEGEYACWKCDKSFKMRFYLGVHLLEVHDMKPDEWLEKISKMNVTDLEAVKTNSKPYNPPEYRKKKRRGRLEKQKNALDTAEKRKTKSGPKRKRGRSAKSRPKKVDSEEEHEESNEEPSESESNPGSESDDNDSGDSDFSGAKESACSEPKRRSTRIVKRKTFKEYNTDDDEVEDDEVELEATKVSKSNSLIIEDEKLNRMRSSVCLRKIELDTQLTVFR